MIAILLITKLGNIMEHKKNQPQEITNPTQMNTCPR